MDYIWLADRLVGISVNHGAILSVHTDWLGRPEIVTGVSTPTIAWRSANAVYDRKVTYNLLINRFNVFFPGQYYDSETGLYYNWHRYYDATTGRYIQSDPIGLDGGINTYAYAGGNPSFRVDPTGLVTPEEAVLIGELAALTHEAGMGFGLVGLAGAAGVGTGVAFDWSWEHLAGQTFGGSVFDFLNGGGSHFPPIKPNLKIHLLEPQLDDPVPLEAVCKKG
jgi:RHS repeat-associated protein